MNLKKATKLQLIEAYHIIQKENIELINKNNVSSAKLQMIEQTIPQKRGFMFWLTKVFKVIELILTILKYDDKTTLKEFAKPK